MEEGVRVGDQRVVGAKTPQKAYKHVSVLTLSHIKRVIDVNETAGKEGLTGI